MKLSPVERDAVSNDALLKSRKAAASKKKAIDLTETPQGCAPCGEKDYQNPCPVLWAESHDGTCTAPVGYSGVCKTAQSFWGADKKDAENICGVCWPCKGEAGGCDRNWDAPCPRGYSLKDIPLEEYADAVGGACVRDLDEDGMCEPQITFEDAVAKQSFAERCGATWPCKSRCEADVASECPKDWVALGDNLCAAPRNYKVSGCRLLQHFRGWTAPMKTAFAEKCRVVWPCDAGAGVAVQGDGPVSQSACSSLDLSIRACPRNWLRRDDGFCSPQIASAGPCAAAKDFREMAAEQKLFWASECFADWKCVGESDPEGGGARFAFRLDTADSGPVAS